MALIVETGTGDPAAESYASVADADAYWAARGAPSTWTAATESAKEAVLRAATVFIDGRYATRWPGRRQYDAQALAWPRYGGYDAEGFAIPDSGVPVSVRHATIEAAKVQIEQADGLFPSGEVAATVKREMTKVGPIETETEYTSGQTAGVSIPSLDAILSRLIRGAGASMGIVERG